MWLYNDDVKKWESVRDVITKDGFDFLKQELYSTRFYSKFLSGATYIPLNSTSDIYEILGKWTPKSWYLSSAGSVYSQTLAPARYAKPIDKDSMFDFYTRFLSEYGLTLKNLFTPDRLIADSLKNIVEVDFATTNIIDLDREYQNDLVIDGNVVKKGNTVLVKDQVTLESIDSTLDPSTYFVSNFYLENDFGGLKEYRYYNNLNGIYKYDGKSLIKQANFEDYEDCVRSSVYVRSGEQNANLQFHLSRLNNGYFPVGSLAEPMEFAQRKNWLLRHRVDYNNLFEINYYDVLRHPATQYFDNGMTYSIPERTISIGEFGVINVHQNGITNIIPNKYKTNLRSISMTLTDYWITGDESLLLRVRKHDFEITKIKVPGYDVLRSVSFYDNQRGVVVGDLNMILITFDGGDNWKRLRIQDFDSYTYNKAVFASYNKIYVAGRAGVFIEIEETPGGWMAYKRRISRFVDDDDENILVDNINDILRTTVYGWTPTYNFIDKPIPGPFELLLMVTDAGNIVVYDIGKSTVFDFIYLDFEKTYGDIINISRSGTSKYFYFTNNEGLFRFNIEDFTKVGVNNSYSNTSISTVAPVKVNSYYANETFDYQGSSLVIAGNNSLLLVGTYSSNLLSTGTVFQVQDEKFESRLKSKLLFMDYDMASKLNFFTDAGDYRLPQPVSFNTMLGSQNSTYVNSSPVPQTDINDNKLISWISYVTYDPAKTRGKLKEIRVSLSMNIKNAALTTILLVYSANSTSPKKIMSIARTGQMKPGEKNLTNVIFSTNTNYPSITTDLSPITGKVYRMDMVSPPYRVNDTVFVNTNIMSEMARKIGDTEEVSGTWEIYAYDNFGNGVSLSSVTLDFYFENSNLFFTPSELAPVAPSYTKRVQNNWWTYRSDSETTFRYFSSTLPSTTNKILMSASFSSYALYSTFSPYKIVMAGDTTFGRATIGKDIGVLFPNWNDDKSMKFYTTGQNITIGSTSLQPRLKPNNLFMVDDYMVLEVESQWAVSVGDVIRLESDVVDANLVVNRIVTFSRKTPAYYTGPALAINKKAIYMFHGFNETILNEFEKTSVKITMWNLNRYVSIDNLVENFSKHPLGIAYGVTYSNDTLTVSPRFNSETAYYNLGTRVTYDGVLATMSYTDAFMKFGYSPTYNLLDYLESINKSSTNPTFYYDKEYYSLPVYEGLPMLNPFTADSVYIDASGVSASMYEPVDGTGGDTGNKLVFGSNLRFEWESLMLNTFVDVSIYQPTQTNTFHANRLLVFRKYEVPNYEGSGILGLVVEFHKRIKFVVGTLEGAKINIRSRRKLGEISADLQELNNIQPGQFKTREISSTVNVATFSVYQNELNFKIPTDSYAKVLMSDSDTVNSLSAIFYVDHKNELAMNVTKVDRSYEIPITNTSNYNGNLMINCGQKHGLEEGDGVILEFTGGNASSQFENPQYFGHHSVKQVINLYDVVINIPYGNPVYIGNDSGVLKFLKKDPFMNYQPVDIIEVGSEKTTAISIKLEPENVALVGATFSLKNVDYNRFRFKLVDGLSLSTLSNRYPWILEAEISDAVIGFESNNLTWYKGVWESGRWFGGQWWSGDWLYGDWYGGSWSSVEVTNVGDKYKPDTLKSDSQKSTWHTGRWYDGTWNDGTWVSGRWYGGNWNNGSWYNGIWNDGVWNLGRFIGGIWVDGTWEDGFFSCDNEPAFWVDGEWKNGDFENGIWYGGIFGSGKGKSRFGVNSYNSRTAIWKGGLWKSGEFHSGKPLDIPTVSEVHKYSIWYSGQWISGDWYGGVAYNMTFNTGTWHGGILDEIQVIGMNATNNSFIFNGDFRPVLGDTFYVIDNNANNEYSYLGSNLLPKKYTVMKTLVYEQERTTEVFVDSNITLDGLPAYKRNSGILNLDIPNNSKYLVHTQSVYYGTNEVTGLRVKLNLYNKNIGDLVINLKAPNGQVINIKDKGVGGVNSVPLDLTPTINTRWKENPNNRMVDTIFTTDNVLTTGFNSPQTGLYQMSLALNIGSLVADKIPVSTTNEVKGLADYDGTVDGDWSINIWDSHQDVSRKMQLRYTDIGENLRLSTGVLAFTPGSSPISQFRIGDQVDVKYTDDTVLKSEIIDMIGSNNGFSLILAATASDSKASLFTPSIYPPWTIQGKQLASKNTIFYGSNAATVTITLRSNPNPFNRLVSWELQLMNDKEVGAQYGRPIEEGFDTGLRVVSDFKNVDWLSGIWSNGIFSNGNFRGGIFLNGIFKGKMGV